MKSYSLPFKHLTKFADLSYSVARTSAKRFCRWAGAARC